MAVIDSVIYLVDTNMVSYIAIARSPAARRSLNRAIQDNSVAIAAITEGEVLFGLVRKGAKPARLQAAVDLLFPRLTILLCDSAAARTYRTLRAQLFEAENYSLPSTRSSLLTQFLRMRSS